MFKMLRKSSYFLILFFGLVVLAAEKVPVELQWEELPGAKTYDLEIKDLQGKPLKSVQSPSALFKFLMPPGKYQFRCRGLDSRGVPGEWSTMQTVEVAPPAPKLGDFAANTAKSSKVVVAADVKSGKGQLLLNWDKVPSAEEYEIQVRDEGGKVIQSKKLTDSIIELSLPPGNYQYRLFSKTKDHISEPTAWSKTIQVSANALMPPEIPEFTEEDAPEILQVAGIDNGLALQVELERKLHFSNQWTKVENFKIDQDRIQLGSFAPGFYRLTLWYVREGWAPSKKIERLFIAKPTEEVLLKRLKE